MASLVWFKVHVHVWSVKPLSKASFASNVYLLVASFHRVLVATRWSLALLPLSLPPPVVLPIPLMQALPLVPLQPGLSAQALVN